MPKTVAEVFTYTNNETGEVLHFSIDEMTKSVRMNPTRMIYARLPIEEAAVEDFRKNRGIEPEYLAAMTPEKRDDPIYAALMEENSVLVVDGNHRFVKRWDDGFKEVNTIIFPEEVWRECLIKPVRPEVEAEIIAATKEQRRANLETT